MHDQLLRRFAGDLLDRRSSASHRSRRTGPDAFGLDEGEVEGFLAGTLSDAEEARLAEEIAEVLPLGWSLSPRGKERLSSVTDRLGGQRQLLEWLDRHPGLPRLTARVFVLMGTLDQYTDDPEVLDALRSARSADPFPAALREDLPPETDEETLGDLASRLEELLGERHTREATRVALASADWLLHVSRQANTPSTRRLGELMHHLRREIGDAASEV